MGNTCNICTSRDCPAFDGYDPSECHYVTFCETCGEYVPKKDFATEWDECNDCAAKRMTV